MEIILYLIKTMFLIKKKDEGIKIQYLIIKKFYEIKIKYYI